MLRDAMATLSALLEANASQPVTYRRGKHSLTRNFLIGRVEMTLGPEFGGTQTRVTDKVFIDPNPALLVICNGEQARPQEGDLIDIEEAGTLNRYVVHRESKDQPEYEWDVMRTSMRIKTKFWKSAVNGCFP